MPHIKFSFLYRDAANYKTFGEVVFVNPENLPLESARQILLQACNSNQNFDPRPWGIANIRNLPYDPELDHDWFEFESMEETKEEITEAIGLSEFLVHVKSYPLG